MTLREGGGELEGGKINVNVIMTLIFHKDLDKAPVSCLPVHVYSYVHTFSYIVLDTAVTKMQILTQLESQECIIITEAKIC